MKPIIKVPLKYGIFGSMMVVVMFLVFYFAGSNPLIEMNTFDFFILPIFLFFGVKEFRDNFNGKYLEFWEGMTVGFIIYATIALLTSLFIFVFLISDGGTLLAGYIQSTAEGFEATRPETIKELGEAIYVQELQDIKSTTASIVFLDNLFRKAAVGLLLTIMLSVITRKKMPDPANN